MSDLNPRNDACLTSLARPIISDAIERADGDPGLAAHLLGLSQADLLARLAELDASDPDVGGQGKS